MGVWIETTNALLNIAPGKVTPCMGVWIETSLVDNWETVVKVTPCMGVWIETLSTLAIRLR